MGNGGRVVLWFFIIVFFNIGVDKVFDFCFEGVVDESGVLFDFIFDGDIGIYGDLYWVNILDGFVVVCFEGFFEEGRDIVKIVFDKFDVGVVGD